jgi:hypothetical protein
MARGPDARAGRVRRTRDRRQLRREGYGHLVDRGQPGDADGLRRLERGDRLVPQHLGDALGGIVSVPVLGGPVRIRRYRHA